MPPSKYLLLHSKARLSSDERQALIRGLEATFSREDGGNDGEGSSHDRGAKDDKPGQEEDN